MDEIVAQEVFEHLREAGVDEDSAGEILAEISDME